MVLSDSGSDPGSMKTTSPTTMSARRSYSNETTPLVTPYEYCDYQGIAAGWGDDYDPIQTVTCTVLP